MYHYRGRPYYGNERFLFGAPLLGGLLGGLAGGFAGAALFAPRPFYGPVAPYGPYGFGGYGGFGYPGYY
ncbi:hypothetical protein [Bacillus sp. S/N-304-OC-R1]|uniref:hypothetical protein n=1 Tax=Bacillus sp. S/N-304-OC-R1 TaxID=2758034 RepID=UPI001C8DC9D6|nr:hypothetical protein [Bacillus sp. S/N-304-OC-R1]MBY0124279.1 hypothetical protein [Bacillus sp. S/N-304-OC-R1]